MKLRAGFDLARAGNFPSVASNVLAALVLSTPAGSGWPAPGVLGWAVVAGCLLYAGGATLNDVADAAFDARHRPERAIPRRIVTRRAAAWLGGGEMVLGFSLLLAWGAAPFYAGALVAAILAYDWIHKRWSGSVALMAGCRLLLAFALASFPGQAAGRAFHLWVAALFVYIITLSAIARGEHRSTATTSARIGRNVGRLLAFIPLLDAVALAAVGAWLPAVACAAAVPIGRWAQRVAAST